jgi:hypothetical protein
MSTFNASHSGMWQNLPRDDGGRTTALLILMACRERPLFGPVVPAEVDNLRRQLQLHKRLGPAPEAQNQQELDSSFSPRSRP